MIKTITFFLSLILIGSAVAGPLNINVMNLDSEVTIRLEVGPQNFDFRYFEDLQVTTNGQFTFTRDVAVGEHYQISFTDQPDSEICAAATLTGEYSDTTPTIDISCVNRSVTITPLSNFSVVSNNILSTVITAKLRDNEQAATGLLSADVDIIQDSGLTGELLFSQNDGYFRHLLPLRDMAPEFHWVIAFDLSNSVSQAELDLIKSETNAFLDQMAVESTGEIPEHISITLNIFDESLKTLISQSRNVEALKAAINGITRSNKGADHYDSIVTSLNQLTTAYTRQSIQTGAVIVVTDGTHDVGTGSAATVSSIRGFKPLHFIAIGNDVAQSDLETMAGTRFIQRIMNIADFSTLGTSLMDSVSENVKHMDASYLLLAASPIRDSTSHTLTTSLVDQVTCANDGRGLLTVPPCFDTHTGSYLLSSLTASASPEVLVNGQNRLNFNEKSSLKITTLWSSDQPNYNIATVNNFSDLSVSPNSDNTELTLQLADQNISSVITVTDNNWNVSAEKSIFSPGFIGFREVTNGTAGNDISSVAMGKDLFSIDIEISSENFETTPVWEVSLAQENEISLLALTQGNTPQYRLVFSNNNQALNITNTLQVTDSANQLTAQLPITAVIEADGLEEIAFNTFINRYGLDAGAGANTDFDNDGVSDLDEFKNGTNPRLADSDFDGISDQLELKMSDRPTTAKHQISLGYDHSCLLDDNNVTCTLNDTSSIKSGVDSVPELKNPILLSSGQNFSCAVDDNGLKCWGINSDSVNTAPAVTGVSELASGFRHSCILVNEQVQCWGQGSTDILNPPTGLSNPSNLTVGTDHACILDDTGPKCWGDNQNGQTTIPTDISGVSEISAGRFHTCVIAQGTVNCWGASSAEFGQTTVPAITNPRNLRSSENANCVDSDNGLVCWGQSFDFTDLTQFNNGLYQLFGFDIHPNLARICAFDLQGIKCLDGFANALTAQTFQLVNRRIPKTSFNYDNSATSRFAMRVAQTFTLETFDTSGNRLNQIVFGRDSNDIPVAGDFDGDGVTDVATRRPSSSLWYVQNSGGTNFNSSRNDGIQRVSFGLQSTDVPVIGDYDGDNLSDIAFWRPANSTWYIQNSSKTNLGSSRNDGIQRHVFGLQSDDIPVPGDYDGDRITDIAFWRASNNTWYVRNSSGSQFGSNRGDGIQRFIFDASGAYQPHTADFDGDGITDMGLYNSTTGQWLIRQSSNLQAITVEFPESIGGIAIPADYTGDGIADLAIWNASEGEVVLRNSADTAVTEFSYGGSKIIPVAAIATQRMVLAASTPE